VLSEALPPTDPSRPRVKLNLLLGVSIGIFLGIAFALGQELRDRRIRGMEDALQVFGLPVLVTMPSGRQRQPAAPSWIRARLQHLKVKRRALEAAG